MTRVADALREATAKLAATSDTARLDAELLMAHALGMTRSDMLVRAMLEPSPEAFDALIERRSRREPVAYIIGHQEFYGRHFAVCPGILIPRGDSETIIEAAIEKWSDASRVLDLGTGSGALLITALIELRDASGIGVDASREAVEIAERNAQTNRLIGSRARFMQRDWRNDGWTDDLGAFDLILCNPPYVEDDAELDPDVRDYEPASALFAGPDGLDDYRILIPQLGKLLAPGGIALFEIGAAQAPAVTEIAQNHGFVVEMRRDLAKRPRVLILTRPN